MQRGQEENQTWTQGLNQDALVGGAVDDDFTKYLELENDFSHFDSSEQQTGPSGLDTPMGRLTFGQGGQVQALTPQQQAMMQDIDLQISNMQPHMTYAHLQQQQQQQHQLSHSQQFQQYPMFQQIPNAYQHQVPPTPVSTEMHAAKYAAKYTAALDSAGQLIFDRQNASFTPLVSPAQTPVDNLWAMPDYIVADDFFSPLTSPAIEAQHNHFSSTNTTTSPVDISIGQPTAARKSRRKINPTSRAATTRNVRSSPATKPLTRKRQVSLSAANKDDVQQVTEQAKYLLPGVSNTNAVSSEDSVSPEALSEALMRPPPVPQARTPSILRGQTQTGNAPATPATLMRIPGKQPKITMNDGQPLQSSEGMEDIELPAAAAELSSRELPDLNTELFLDDDDQSTPTISAKTPKLSAESTPRSTGPRPSSHSQDSNGLPKVRAGRQSKKRQSISQATISPALRPRISPSISPLVPNTGAGMSMLSAETSALYLASKSNYQNIIDGTHLPGVSYPETLAENLSSKRTSHKLAEQGRRNRINIALKEIEVLLPPSILAASRKDKTSAKEDADLSDKLSTAQGASKASTVEMAIIYIKSLQAELQETREKLEAAEKLLAEGNSSGSQTSDQTNT